MDAKKTDGDNRKLVIKHKVIKRLYKEAISYIEEEESQRRKIDKMISEKKDVYEIRQQQKVLQETLIMIPDAKKRLSKAIEDIGDYLCSNSTYASIAKDIILKSSSSSTSVPSFEMPPVDSSDNGDDEFNGKNPSNETNDDNYLDAPTGSYENKFRKTDMDEEIVDEIASIKDTVKMIQSKFNDLYICTHAFGEISNTDEDFDEDDI